MYFYLDFIPSQQEKKVLLSLSYNTSNCSSDFPLQLEVLNESNRTIQKISFTISAKMIGHSADMVSSLDSYEETKIISANSKYSSCWAIPPLKTIRKLDHPIDHSKLHWTIKSRIIEFGR